MIESFDQEHQTLGLIGLGLLGTAISERLLENRAAVFGFDLDEQRRMLLNSAKGRAADSAGQVFAQCPIVLLSLPTSEVVQRLIADHVSEMRAGQILVDTTTGDPEQMLTIGKLLEQHGIHYVEANVAGSSRQMRSGVATLFLGGNADVIRALRPLWQWLSDKFFELGPLGSASKFKLVHNLVLGLNRAVLAEGLTFAEALGFDPANVLEVLKQTPAASVVMETKGQKMVERDWAPEAKLSQHLKDVRLILAIAAANQTPAPLCSVHQDLLELAQKSGFGEADNSAILEAFSHKIG